ncbi:GNAT family N-acetyltransferase [Devosia faecipullorum]|uniref:GNAT family N-acetyltransferase n=1 Tax=Devosia faecipullorum TaxID=2755039 RepID=UPI00187B6812|nr:GNAT family N-acetyltransferase [Devosia faecipullorum]MBE7732298.1 GNAT family N-acetyltransferase [Devosia faecipullorum]
MRRYLDATLTPPAAPAGIALLPLWRARPIELHALLRESYAGGGGSVGDFDTWFWPLVEDSEFDPGLMLIAADGEDRPLGLAQSWTSGFLKDLVVAPGARRQGVGAFLLETTFNAFRTRGLDHVDLKVEADNYAARLFYARHVMVEIDQ